MAKVTEIAPGVYRISIYAQRGDVQFNHFLVKDEEPFYFTLACEECTLPRTS